MIRRQRYPQEFDTRIFILDRRIGHILPLAKIVALVGALEQRTIRRWLPMRSSTPCWCLWGRATRFVESEKAAEEGAEEGEGDEDEAEGLFGTVGGLSVPVISAETEHQRTNHAQRTRKTSFPVEIINQGFNKVSG